MEQVCALYRMGLRRLVSPNPPPKANPMDVLFQSVWFRLTYWLFWAVYITVFWFVLGPASKVAAITTPWYAVSVAFGTCSLVVAVPAPAVMRRVPRQWFRVPARERLLHRMLGVGLFGWLLDVSGWNRRVLEPLRAFSGKRAGLPSLEQSLRTAAVSHGISFAIHVLLAVLALFSRHPWSAAFWMLMPGVVLHLYPVLLQRSIILRLQPLLDKTGSVDSVGN
jgi:Glycosyl-4,4'-diaponeurosporenoate acyltransferase